MTSDFTPLACSADSRTANEPLFATVKPTRAWLMLEYDAPYGAKALADSALPQPVKDWLNGAAAALQSSRVLLIRQLPRQAAGGVRLFVAIADELQPALYEFELYNHQDLLDLDLSSEDTITRRYAAYRREEPLFLVCTNGRRDPCCAAYGLPVYNSLAGAQHGEVWQTSHVGGHRFAANLACMPDALFYGHVDEQVAPRLLAAYRREKLVVEHYRGRACYSKIVQAAEYFLRRERRLPGLRQLRLLAETPAGEGVHHVRFQAAGESGELEVRLRVLPEGHQVLASCQDEQAEFNPAYQLLDIS